MGTVSAVDAMGRCQDCGMLRQISPVKFHHNIRMVVLRQTRSIQGIMCKSCIGKRFWEYQGKNLLFGPWGLISIIVTPIYLITNTVSYVSALRKLRGAVE
jgi:hypothetical protein